MSQNLLICIWLRLKLYWKSAIRWSYFCLQMTNLHNAVCVVPAHLSWNLIELSVFNGEICNCFNYVSEWPIELYVLPFWMAVMLGLGRSSNTFYPIGRVSSKKSRLLFMPKKSESAWTWGKSSAYVTNYLNLPKTYCPNCSFCRFVTKLPILDSTTKLQP